MNNAMANQSTLNQIGINCSSWPSDMIQRDDVARETFTICSSAGYYPKGFFWFVD